MDFFQARQEIMGVELARSEAENQRLKNELRKLQYTLEKCEKSRRGSVTTPTRSRVANATASRLAQEPAGARLLQQHSVGWDLTGYRVCGGRAPPR